MAEQRVTGSSQRNAKDVAYELTELYYTTVVNKESMKDVYSTCVSTKTLDESPMAYKPGEEIEELIKDTCLIVDHLVPKYNFKAE